VGGLQQHLFVPADLGRLVRHSRFANVASGKTSLQKMFDQKIPDSIFFAKIDSRLQMFLLEFWESLHGFPGSTCLTRRNSGRFPSLPDR
jgi:hypothetical protein